MATRARQLKEVIGPIRFTLRREDAAGGPRCFFAELAAFNHGHAARTPQCEFARDRQADNASADDYDISKRCSIGRLIALHAMGGCQLRFKPLSSFA
jgi:hypothetical protein